MAAGLFRARGGRSHWNRAGAEFIFSADETQLYATSAYSPANNWVVTVGTFAGAAMIPAGPESPLRPAQRLRQILPIPGTPNLAAVLKSWNSSDMSLVVVRP